MPITPTNNVRTSTRSQRRRSSPRRDERDCAHIAPAAGAALHQRNCTVVSIQALVQRPQTRRWVSESPAHVPPASVVVRQFCSMGRERQGRQHEPGGWYQHHLASRASIIRSQYHARAGKLCACSTTCQPLSTESARRGTFGEGGPHDHRDIREERVEDHDDRCDHGHGGAYPSVYSEQFMTSLLRRAKLFPAVSVRHTTVHRVEDVMADVTMGTRVGARS